MVEARQHRRRYEVNVRSSLSRRKVMAPVGISSGSALMCISSLACGKVASGL